jgi:hypothetical protein
VEGQGDAATESMDAGVPRPLGHLGADIAEVQGRIKEAFYALLFLTRKQPLMAVTTSRTALHGPPSGSARSERSCQALMRARLETAAP